MSVTTGAPPLSWEPPPIGDLNFTRNCTAAALWVAGEEFEILPTIRFLRNSVPQDLDPPPTSFQLLEWFNNDIYHQNRQLFEAMYFTALENCTAEACRELDWRGSADIAGIGMVITYYLEAAISSIYFAVLAHDRFRYADADMPVYLDTRYSFIEAFRGSLDEFLNSATIFAMSMLVASIFENSYNALTYGIETTTYATLLSMLLPIFTLFPIAILHSLVRKMRRQWLRRTIWIMLTIQLIAVCVLATATFHYLRKEIEADPKLDSRLSAESAFEIYCAPNEYEFSVRPAFKAGAAVFTIFGGFWFIFILNFPHLPLFRENDEDKKKKFKAWRDNWWIVVAGLSFIGMWTYLGLFTAYRRMVVAKAGISQQDTRWSFGQVLALATWVPVVIDFGYIFFFGSKVGIEGRISYPWRLHFDLELDEDAVSPSVKSVQISNVKARLLRETQDGTAPNLEHRESITSLPYSPPLISPPAGRIHNDESIQVEIGLHPIYR